MRTELLRLVRPDLRLICALMASSAQPLVTSTSRMLRGGPRTKRPRSLRLSPCESDLLQTCGTEERCPTLTLDTRLPVCSLVAREGLTWTATALTDTSVSPICSFVPSTPPETWSHESG
eukprot:2444387-Rhodomonas_salina.1